MTARHAMRFLGQRSRLRLQLRCRATQPGESHRIGIGLSVGLVLSLSGCKDLTGTQPLPSGTVNPTFYHTPAGALGLRAHALYQLERALPSHVVLSGLLGDELESNTMGVSSTLAVSLPVIDRDVVNARLLSEQRYGGVSASPITDDDYTGLQIAREELNQARAAVAAYDTGAKAVGDPKVLRAELFALEGYTELLLADFFCSGVPLSTVDFGGDYTYHAGSTTAQVYEDVIVREDSALALADTSTQVQYLARVLKGRALLALGGTANVAAAAQVVAPVPDGFRYQLAVQFDPTAAGGTGSVTNTLTSQATVADTEGRNGLPYLSSNDPRTATSVIFAPGQYGLGGGGGGIYNSIMNAVPLTFPVKYSPDANVFSPFVVASGVEARLIEAEAALRAGSSTWLATLNALRTSGGYLPPDTLPPDTLGVTHCGGSYGLCGSGPGGIDPSMGQPAGGYAPIGYSVAWADTVSPAPAINGDPTYIQNYCNANSWYQPCYNGDTMVVLHYVRPAGWTAGTGGVSNLAPLADPGTDSARVALVFRERAFWLFLTGERQGDLRRLLRQYRQWFHTQDQVYPTGAYSGVGTATYGSAVTAPIPGAEDLNPLFHGCLDRNP